MAEALISRDDQNLYLEERIVISGHSTTFFNGKSSKIKQAYFARWTAAKPQNEERSNGEIKIIIGLVRYAQGFK